MILRIWVLFASTISQIMAKLLGSSRFTKDWLKTNYSKVEINTNNEDNKHVKTLVIGITYFIK